ncbi:MAG: hypothetical protein U0556_04020 [Dehalococcoidia bacterium]
MQVAPRAPDLRAEIARRQIRVYELAAAVHIHPGRLGCMLSERLPMPAEVADRIDRAIRVWPEGGSQ